MLKTLALVGGVVGTGIYFGGITSVMQWQVDRGKPVPGDRELVLELGDREVALALGRQEELRQPEKPRASQDRAEDQRPELQGRLAAAASPAEAAAAGGTEATPGQKDEARADFRMTHEPTDSVVTIVYWIPGPLYPDSVFVDITVFDLSVKLSRLFL